MVHVSLFMAIACGQTTTISNAHFRVNNESNPFDAHDGSIQQFRKNGPYYYHAMGYGTFLVLFAAVCMSLCADNQMGTRCAACSGTCMEDGKKAEGGCGQTSNNTVGVWRSNTLASGTWELLHTFRPSSSGWPNCTYGWAGRGVTRMACAQHMQ